MNYPLVSIIIPTYNRAHLICETLDSVLVQTYTNWECIIIDDGSTDNTVKVVGEYVKKDARFQCHERPKDRLSGGNAARNYGFEMSKGEYVNWFDDDDIMLEDFIKNKIMSFSPDEKLIVDVGVVEMNHTDVSSRPYNFSSTVETIKSHDSLFEDFLLWRVKIITACPMFRRSFLEDKLLFDLHILRGQETEFFSRIFFKLSKRDYSIIKSDSMIYRQHPNTKSYNDKKYDTDLKKSLSTVFIRNLELCLQTENTILIQHTFNNVINVFFDTVRNNDKKVSKVIIYKTYKLLLTRLNTFKAIKFLIIAYTVSLFSLKSIRLKKQLKSII